jgi:MFS family permease
MTLLDVSIVNVAVPSMDRALGASPSDLQWVLSGYALTFGLILVPAGRFGDARGRRNAFVLGIALFTLMSALAGMAQSPGWLVTARLLQGAAAGIVNADRTDPAAFPGLSGAARSAEPPSVSLPPSVPCSGPAHRGRW